MQAPAKDEGYYVVLFPGPMPNLSEVALSEAAVRLRLKVSELNRIVETGQRVPLTRLPTSEEAAQVGEVLQTLGIENVMVPSAGLNLDAAPKKVRALEISDCGPVASVVASPDKPTARWEDVILLVIGRLVANRVEVEERRRRGRNQPVDTRQLSSDETVLDVYATPEAANWRITSNSFDFSCLGTAKAATTFENFAALARMLRARAPNASLDDSYARSRPALETVWPIEQQTKRGDWRRSGAGKFDVATVTTTDNQAQFTRYSRLLHYLRLRELADSG